MPIVANSTSFSAFVVNGLVFADCERCRLLVTGRRSSFRLCADSLRAGRHSKCTPRASQRELDKSALRLDFRCESPLSNEMAEFCFLSCLAPVFVLSAARWKPC